MAALATVGGCPEPEPDTSLGGSQAIFTDRCATSSCHSGELPQANLSLESGEARGQLIGVPTLAFCLPGTRVVPGDPEASCLWELVSNDSMPFNRKPLSAAEKDTLFQWIADGAAE